MKLRITLLLSTIYLLFQTSAAFAVPAAPLVHTLEQGDGTTFSARRWGDEHNSGWETAEGYSILFDEAEKGWMYAARGKDGTLVSSGHRVGSFTPEGVLSKKIRPDKKPERRRPGATFNRTPALAAATGGAAAANPLLAAAPPAMVTANVPVILVNFKNTATTYAATDFNTLLFGSSNNSMSDYYSEVSYGAFTVSPGPAGVIGWFKAANIHNYYGQNVNGFDAKPGDLVYEAVQAADATVDFSQYDRDGDCYVDTVAIVHQGAGEEAGTDPNDIWSHSWDLASAKYFGNSTYDTYTTNDICKTNPSQYVKINDYIIQPETFGTGISTVGVFAHEYGHALGLPDLYDTDNTSQGIGNWSLMAGGSWNGVSRGGDRPAHLDPWSRYALGWIAPVRIGTTTTGKTIAPVETGAELYQLLGSGTQSGAAEYFLLENRQKTGFDAALPGSGLLIWHIDELMSDNKSEWYPGCTSCTSHYKVALVQADNNFNLEKNNNGGDSGDPFPGSANRQSFNIASAPGNNLYSGSSAGFSLDAIAISGQTATLDITFVDTVLTSTPPALSNSATAGFSFSSPSAAATFQCKMDSVPWAGCTSPATYSGLAEGTHTFSVKATDSQGATDSTPATHSWTVDTSPPETSISSGPAAFATTASATFNFTSPDPAATFSCSLDNAQWSSCSSPATFSGLVEGSHSLRVRAVDPAGNIDSTPSLWSWSISLSQILKLVASGQQDTYFTTLAAAMASLPPAVPATLNLIAGNIAESITINSCGQVITFKGGYDNAFTVVTGSTLLPGPIIIGCGTLIIDNLVIL